MKNLKKVLALVLAFACAFTMFAGAAFTDEADISAKDAVNMLTALGVIDGYDDGSFQPDGVVTRAEMAKMIFVVRNNKADDAAYQNISTSLTDINDHWAKGYIKFCESQGIIAGKSYGIFDPDAPVTGLEAAKMLLVLTGYTADKAGLEGAAWATNTLRHAGAAGILEDVNSGLEAGLPRQYAAQMIYNTLDADRVLWSNDSETFDPVLNGGEKETVGYAYMDLVKEKDILTSVAEDSRGTYTINVNGNFTKVTADYTDLLGQEVEVLYKENERDTVYGVYATDNNDVTIKTTIGKLAELKTADRTFEVDGTKVKYAGGIVVNTINDVTGADSGVASLMWNNGTYNTASTVYLVSNDGDSNIDIAVVAPSEVVKVNYVGASSITLGGSIGSIDLEDVQTYDGIAKGDFVLYTADANNTVNNKDTVAKVDIVEGTVSATKGSIADKNLELQVGDNWYKVGRTDSNAVADNTNVKAADNVALAVYDGYYYSADANSEPSAQDIVFVYEAGNISSGVNSGVEASVLFADGTAEKITVSKLVDPDDEDSEFAVGEGTNSKIKTVNELHPDNANAFGNRYANANGTYWNSGAVLAVGAMYTYEMDGAKYKLRPINDNNMAGYDSQSNSAAGWDGTNDRLEGWRVNDDAVIFVAKNLNANTTGAEAKVITGSALKTWSNYGTDDFSQAIALENNGINSVDIGAVVEATDTYGAEDGNYGILVDDAVAKRVNGTNYVSLKVWTGSGDEPVEMLIKGNNPSAYRKGDTFSFDGDGDEDGVQVIKNYTVITQQGAMLGAEADGTKYDVEITGSNGLSTGSHTYKVDEDTTILFINGKAGVNGGDLTEYEAMPTTIDNLYVNNVLYVKNADNTLDLIVVAIDGILNQNDDVAVGVVGGADNIRAINGKTITLAKNSTLAELKEELTNVIGVEGVTYCGTAGAGATGSVKVITLEGEEIIYTVDCSNGTFTADV